MQTVRSAAGDRLDWVPSIGVFPGFHVLDSLGYMEGYDHQLAIQI